MRRILIADPDPILLSIYEKSALKANWDVRITSSPLTCIDLLFQFQPSYMLIDPDLLWGCGKGVLSQLCGECGVPHLRVIVQTNRPLAGMQHDADHPKVILCIPKPIAPIDLFDIIDAITDEDCALGCAQM